VTESHEWRQKERNRFRLVAVCCGIIVCDDGFFAAVSDYGNYAYRWTHHGCDDFRKFFLKCNPEYLQGKLAEKELSVEKSFRQVKDELLETRRYAVRKQPPFTLGERTRARECWEHIKYYEAYNDWDGFVRDSDTYKYFDEPWQFAVGEYPSDIREFTETTICKRLRALIQAELEVAKQEATP
jgi:hypothetical protein